MKKGGAAITGHYAGHGGTRRVDFPATGGNHTGQEGTRRAKNTAAQDPSKRRRTNVTTNMAGAAAMVNKKTFGSFVAIPGKEKPTNLSIFGKDIGLKEQHCLYFHMVGSECMKQPCDFKLKSLFCMDQADRKLLLDHMA